MRVAGRCLAFLLARTSVPLASAAAHEGTVVTRPEAGNQHASGSWAPCSPPSPSPGPERRRSDP